MPLPVISTRPAARPEDLVRLFHQTEVRWVEQIAEAEAFSAGCAYLSPSLDQVYEANHVQDAALPAGASASAAVEEAEAIFARRALRCYYWTMNPSAPAESTGPLCAELKARGHVPVELAVYRLDRLRGTLDHVEGVSVLPARAAAILLGDLAREWATDWAEPQRVGEWERRLDDPAWEPLVAMRGGEGLGAAGLLTMGEVGRIDMVYIRASYRRQGIGRLLMSRVIDICARGLLRHVMVCAAPSNRAAVSLYESMGFGRVGSMVRWMSPATSPAEADEK